MTAHNHRKNGRDKVSCPGCSSFQVPASGRKKEEIAMVKDCFSTYHPVVNFLYFALVLGFTMVVQHPIFLGISLAASVAWSIYLRGRKAVRFTVFGILPMLLFMALINPAFNHEGATILTYLPSGNPLTLESIVYGLVAACMLCAVIAWFSCYNAMMTSDKFLYLFGRIIPALSLVISMALRFVPRFQAQLRQLSNSQKCVGRDASHGNWFRRAKHGVRMLSMMITWALENGLDTADSMSSRGYGLPGRTAFSLYQWDQRDRQALAWIAGLGGYTVIMGLAGGLYVRYFPTFSIANIDAWSLSACLAYGLLCLTPLFLDVREDQMWSARLAQVAGPKQQEGETQT